MVPFCIGNPIPYPRLPQIPTENRITGKRKTEKYDSRKRKSLSPALFFPPFFGRNSWNQPVSWESMETMENAYDSCSFLYTPILPLHISVVKLLIIVFIRVILLLSWWPFPPDPSFPPFQRASTSAGVPVKIVKNALKTACNGSEGISKVTLRFRFKMVNTGAIKWFSVPNC